jgi:hypothetical protein
MKIQKEQWAEGMFDKPYTADADISHVSHSDKFTTIISDGIMVAQGLKCGRCGVIRTQSNCSCD